MTQSPAVRCPRRAACVLLGLLLSAAIVAPATAALPVAPANPAGQAIQASPAPATGPVLATSRSVLIAGIIGDRQRMVQVGLIFMGIAILILTRGNRF